jgi:hypothetical protein
MNMPAREYWETTQDPDGTWAAWRASRVQSSGFVDLDEALAYISGRAERPVDVTIEWSDHRTEVRSL